MAVTPKEAYVSPTRYSQTTTLKSEPVSGACVLFAPASWPLAATLRQMLGRDLAAAGSLGNLYRNLSMIEYSTRRATSEVGCTHREVGYLRIAQDAEA